MEAGTSSEWHVARVRITAIALVRRSLADKAAARGMQLGASVGLC